MSELTEKLKIPKFSIIIGVILIGIFGLAPNRVYAISRGSDQIILETPIEGANVSGSVEIKWNMRDSNQNSDNIPLLVDIFSKSCPNNGEYYGNILNSHKNVTRTGDEFTYLWNTRDAIQNKTGTPDGEYCLRVCAVFVQNGSNYYGLCDKHTITVSNTSNQSPKISSTPSNLNIKVGDKYSYQVIATDPEGDNLQFSLQQSEPILEIDQSIGLITSPELKNIGNFTVTIVVVDGKGGSDKQVFTLNVTSGDSSSTIKFTVPQKDEILNQDSVNIQWQISNSDNVESVKLSLSSDGENWQELTSLSPGDNHYKWDISKLTNGKYFLLLEAKLKTGENISTVSEPFTIAHQTSGESIPLITELQPEDGSKITDLRPKISAKYTPSDGATIDPSDVSIQLNSSALTNCQKTNSDISCDLQQDLSSGKNKLTIQVKDSAKKVVVRDWYVEAESGNSPQIQIANFWPILLILCVGAIILFIPWLLFVLYNRWKSKNGVSKITQPVSPAPATTIGVNRTVTPVQSVQTYQEAAPPPLIGTQEVTAGVNQIENVAPLSPVNYQQTPEVHQPTMYTSSEIPSWLKDDESGSRPVTETGQTPPPPQKNDENKAAQPYGFA